jgi:23S rRNA (uracil1939-C5)-methyltransferase
MDSSTTKTASAPVLECRAEKWVYGGQSLARVEGHVVLASGLLPGELARVEVTREHAGYREARPLEVLEPAPERIEPRCPLFGRCGGCDYQHAPVDFQLARKAGIVREVFQRVGKIEAPAEIETIHAEPWHYRNRVQLHIDRAHLGYRVAGSHKVAPIEDGCPIAAPRLNEAIAALKPLLRNRRWPRFVRTIELFTDGEKTLFSVLETDGGRRVAREFIHWVAEAIPGAAAGWLDYPAAGHVYRVGHASFFQTNRFLIDPLVEAALRHAEGGETALDLFAGVGLFTIPLAPRYGTVAAVETSAPATRDLAHNAAETKAAVNIHRSNADLYLETLTHAPDFVLADPPRSDLGKNVVKQLARLQPPRITIVSCDPSTLARDLAGLLAAGYSLDSLSLVDLFPHTFHLETICRLARG